MLFLALVYGFLAFVLPKDACADTVNIGDADCGSNLNVSNRVYRLIQNMGCPDIGLEVSVSNVTILLNGFTLTYADDGTGTGAVNGCNTRTEIGSMDCGWNAGGTGIKVTGTGWSGLRIKGPGSIRCFVTDTSVADTTIWSMSAIAVVTAFDYSFNHIVLESLNIYVYTCNSRPFLVQYMDNCTLTAVTCSSGVWHQAMDLTGQDNYPFWGSFGTSNNNYFYKVRLLGRFPGVGLSAGTGANCAIRGSRIEGGENWPPIKKQKNGYGVGFTKTLVSCSLIGSMRGNYTSNACRIESCYFDIHPVPETITGSVPGGAGWAFKLQPDAGWSGTAVIKHNYIRVSNRSAEDGPAAGISIDSYAYGNYVNAKIDSNTFVAWAYKDSVDGPTAYYGDFSTCVWVDAELPWRKSYVSFYDNHYKSNNRVFSSNSPDNFGCDSFYANCGTIERWDTLHTPVTTYSPRFKTYDIRDAGEVGWKFEGLTFTNGASADSNYLVGGAQAPTFGSFDCGGSPPTTGKKLIRGRIKNQ